MKRSVDIIEKLERAERLKSARKAAGFTSGEAAALRFGWNVNTYKAHESGRNGVDIDIARNYAKAFGVGFQWLLTGEGEGPGVVSMVRKDLGKAPSPVGMIRVIGKVAANTWLSVDDMDFGYDDVEYIPSVGGYPIEWQFALVVDGNCLNKIAANGERLICLDIIKARTDIEENDLVIVERAKFNGQMIERTAKRVRIAADGFELWPESTDPAHQEPIRLYRVPEGEEVRVIGKVLWILKKP